MSKETCVKQLLRERGAAQLSGELAVGDVLLEVNGTRLSGLPPPEAQRVLADAERAGGVVRLRARDMKVFAQLHPSLPGVAEAAAAAVAAAEARGGGAS